jgi:hypothetical protein
MHDDGNSIEYALGPSTGRHGCGGGVGGLGGDPQARIAICGMKSIIGNGAGSFTAAEGALDKKRVGDHMHDQIVVGGRHGFAFGGACGG